MSSVPSSLAVSVGSQGFPDPQLSELLAPYIAKDLGFTDISEDQNDAFTCRSEQATWLAQAFGSMLETVTELYGK